jgi:hypothetical protein
MMRSLRMLSPLRGLVQHQVFSQPASARFLHATRPTTIIPRPTPFIPDVETFLKVIGRGLSEHTSKFPTWEALFSMNSSNLRELGVEPPRTRRYLLRWLDRFRNGKFGPGGDFKYVQDGEATLKVAEVPLTDKKWAVNVPVGKELGDIATEELVNVEGYTVRGARTIAGPYALPLQNGLGATVKVVEGMWEDKRGRKIDGGERRRTEVRFKRRVAERRAQREAEGMR